MTLTEAQRSVVESLCGSSDANANASIRFVLMHPALTEVKLAQTEVVGRTRGL